MNIIDLIAIVLIILLFGWLIFPALYILMVIGAISLHIFGAIILGILWLIDTMGQWIMRKRW